MTGAELAAQIDDLLIRRPELSKKRLGMLMYSSKKGVEDIRRAINPRPQTVAKILAIIANPPPEALKKIPAQRMRKIKEPRPRKPANRLLAVRKGLRKRAQERIDAGLPADHFKGAGVRIVQLALEEKARQEHRLRDPVEQALMALRRERRVVYRASVHGGPHDRFYLSGKGIETIGVAELLALAKTVKEAA